MARDKLLDGMAAQESVPEDWSPSKVVYEQILHFQRETLKHRRRIKFWSVFPVVGSAVGAGLIAVLGTLSAAIATNWWDIVLAVAPVLISTLVALILAWDRHFMSRELWLLRSEVLSRLDQVRGDFELQRSEGRAIPAEFRKRLADVKDYYNVEWHRMHEGS